MEFVRELTDVDWATSAAILESLKDYHNTYAISGPIQSAKHDSGARFYKSDGPQIRSTVIEEYTLLVCTAAEKASGKTTIVVNPYYTYVSNELCTPGNAVLFRKGLVCQDCLFEGHKEMILVDVWVSKSNTGEPVFVKFPEETDVSYAFSKEQIMQFPDSLLAGFCRFTDAAGALPQPQKIYKCTDCTCDEFSVVFKVYAKMYLSVEEAELYMPLLSYFGLSDKIRVDFIDNTPEIECESKLCLPDFSLGLGDECCALCGCTEELFTCTKCDETYYCSRRCQKIHWKQSHSEECCCDSDPKDFVILSEENNENDKDLDTKAALAAKLLQPYIRFKIIYANGAKSIGGDRGGVYEPQIYDMEPVCASFGDYSNIYVKHNIMKDWETETWGFDEEDFNLAKQFPPNTKVKLDHNTIKMSEQLQDANQCMCGLLIASEESTEKILDKTLDLEARMFPMEVIILPSKGESHASFEYFHIDGEGKTAFTAEQAAKMAEYIETSEILERIGKKNKVFWYS